MATSGSSSGAITPLLHSGETSAAPLQSNRLVDLVLIDPGKNARKTVTGGEAWLDAVSPARMFHLRRDDAEDGRRLARVLTGQSVGLVLSGGGARAYAHVGAVKALRERKVPIDFVGGSSMGAIISRHRTGSRTPTKCALAFPRRSWKASDSRPTSRSCW